MASFVPNSKQKEELDKKLIEVVASIKKEAKNRICGMCKYFSIDSCTRLSSLDSSGYIVKIETPNAVACGQFRRKR